MNTIRIGTLVLLMLNIYFSYADPGVESDVTKVFIMNKCCKIINNTSISLRTFVTNVTIIIAKA